MKLHFSVLGCRLNEAEVEALGRAAQAAGHQVVSDPAAADWALINTCTVTHVAARKSRQAIRRLHAEAPGAQLAVIGCYASMSPDEALTLPGVALAIPNVDKDRALQLIMDENAVSPQPEGEALGALAQRRTRAFIKVQDGCDNRCTYCVVRIARGPLRSRASADILAEAQARIAEGAQEVVLSGVNIGAYGRDLAVNDEQGRSWGLARLVEGLLAETSVPRIRLSSLEPWDVDARLLDLFSDSRLCRQLHLPLQSGSDAVLRRMSRSMSIAEYRALATEVLLRVPELSLSTDLIVGFPGESDDDFDETCHLIEELGISRLHVFRFSAREGTPAAQMSGRVEYTVAQARARRLIALGAELSEAFNRRYIGQRIQVLFESSVSRYGVQGWSGLTDTYLRVWAPAPASLRNQIRGVRCTTADESGLEGVLEDAP